MQERLKLSVFVRAHTQRHTDPTHTPSACNTEDITLASKFLIQTIPHILVPHASKCLAQTSAKSNLPRKEKMLRRSPQGLVHLNRRGDRCQQAGNIQTVLVLLRGILAGVHRIHALLSAPLHNIAKCHLRPLPVQRTEPEQLHTVVVGPNVQYRQGNKNAPGNDHCVPSGFVACGGVVLCPTVAHRGSFQPVEIPRQRNAQYHPQERHERLLRPLLRA
mmetsp:Transcript_13599/g.39680  ORF Transcript_13599/g.39680 Transcript_13599/m.39680 type:complete len:218 (-) Transcript_13599:985-1638(-)